MMRILTLLLIVLLFVTGLSADEEKRKKGLRLFALFKNKVIIIINDQRRVLKIGQQSPEGVKLISTDTSEETAEFDFEGRRQKIKLGMIATTGIVSSANTTVSLWADRSGHFFANGSINNVATRFLVDTGATAVSMNSNDANRIGIDYKLLGKKGFASTASGYAEVYYLKLNKVKVGDIALYNIDAGVIEGKFPTEILLGMSFLGKLNMKQEGDKLELIKR